MKKLWILSIMMIMILITTTPSWGSAWEITGGQKIIHKGQVINGDYIFNGNRLNVEGEIRGDLIVMAGDVTVKGRVEGSILGVVWEKLTINGIVGRDIRVLAMEIQCNGEIFRNLTAWAYHLGTTGKSKIHQGILGKFIDLTLSGEVAGPVEVTSYASSRISGRIGEDVIVKGAVATWVKPLIINGRIIDYTDAPADPSNLKGVTVVKGYQMKEDPGRGLMLILFMGWLLGSMILSIIFYRLFPQTVWEITEPTVMNFRKNLLVGLISFFAIPSLIAFLSSGIVPYLGLIGLPFIALLILLYLVLLFFSGMLLNLWFGRLLFRSKLNPVLMIVLGGLILTILGALPGVNLLVVLITNCVGYGMILRNIRFQFRNPQAEYRA